MEKRRENEMVSVMLSKVLEITVLGTKELMEAGRRNILRLEYIVNHRNGADVVLSGSKSEGITLSGSDLDVMFVLKNVEVMYPEDSIPPDSTGKTVLYVRQANCRPGYVNLQLGHTEGLERPALVYSLVPVGDMILVSSDMFREYCVQEFSRGLGMELASSGPSTSDGTTDIVVCFHMSSWPREANQWVTRPRLYGWPTQAMIDKIVQNGCHLVPVGDKCFNDTLLQWRLSFASAERLLVHSFSHIQMKVYCLLKYFLKQMKPTLQCIMGEDDDILCSYHLKTVMFCALENSHPQLWQEQNLLYCFWFCFNILISCVRAGHFPQYFIPTNNLFQRKVHGQNQKKLLCILNKFYTKKVFCLLDMHGRSDHVNTLEDVSKTEDIRNRTSCHVNTLEDVSNAEDIRNSCHVNTLEDVSKAEDIRNSCHVNTLEDVSNAEDIRNSCHVNTLEDVSKAEEQIDMTCHENVEESEYTQDMILRNTFKVTTFFGPCGCPEQEMTRATRSMRLLMNSHSDLDEMQIFINIVCFVSLSASSEAHQILTDELTNKTRYRTLRRCQHRLTLCASMGTCILDLATLCFLTGNYSKALELCQHITSQPSYYTRTRAFLPEHLKALYIKQYCGKGYTSFYKLKKTFTDEISIKKNYLHLPHLQLEASREKIRSITISPLPYALFLSFLCCHELRDRRGCDEALRNLKVVKYDDQQGQHWIMRTILGICYETIDDYPRAIKAYQDSVNLTNKNFHNPAQERIDTLLRFKT